MVTVPRVVRVSGAFELVRSESEVFKPLGWLSGTILSEFWSWFTPEPWFGLSHQAGSKALVVVYLYVG